MDTFDAIYQRRAIKQYDPQHKLSAEEETKLLEAAIQAPTSFNIQHWRFVIIRDTDLRKKIRTEFGNDQAQMTDASLLILMTADTKAWQKKSGTLLAKCAERNMRFAGQLDGAFSRRAGMVTARRSSTVHRHGHANFNAVCQGDGLRFLSDDRF